MKHQSIKLAVIVECTAFASFEESLKKNGYTLQPVTIFIVNNSSNRVIASPGNKTHYVFTYINECKNGYQTVYQLFNDNINIEYTIAIIIDPITIENSKNNSKTLNIKQNLDIEIIQELFRPYKAPEEISKLAKEYHNFLPCFRSFNTVKKKFTDKKEILRPKTILSQIKQLPQNINSTILTKIQQVSQTLPPLLSKTKHLSQTLNSILW